MDPDVCVLCAHTVKNFSPVGSTDTYSIECVMCGNYRITREQAINMRTTYLSNRQKANISGWLYENQNYEVTTRNIDQLLNISNPSVIERADKLLMCLAGLETPQHGSYEYNSDWIPISWSVDFPDFLVVIRFLIESEMLVKLSRKSEQVVVGTKFRIYAKGWLRVDELSKSTPDSTHVSAGVKARLFAAVLSSQAQVKNYTDRCGSIKELLSQAQDSSLTLPHRSCFWLT